MFKRQLLKLYSLPTMIILGLAVSTLTYGICEDLKSTDKLVAPAYPKAVEEKNKDKTRQYRDPHYSKENRHGWVEEKTVFHSKDSLKNVLEFYEKKLGKKFIKSGDTYYITLKVERVSCGELVEDYAFSIRIHLPEVANEEHFYLLTDEKDNDEFIPQDKVIERKYKEKSKNYQESVKEKMKALQKRAMAGDRKAAKEMGESGKNLSGMGLQFQEEMEQELEQSAYNVRIVIDHKHTKTVTKKSKDKSKSLKNNRKKGKEITDKIKSIF
ncbi:MAG: hypothetical protein ABUK01_10525 [Leptospirales bacterium]